MTSYDDWKLQSPDDERANLEAAFLRWLRRHNLQDDRDPDDARDEQQDREMRGED